MYRIVVMLALAALVSLSAAQTQAQVAREFSEGFRRTITGREVRCPDPFPEQGASCFEAMYTADRGVRLTDSMVGDIPGVVFNSPWMSSTVGDVRSRTFIYRGREYAVFIVNLGEPRIMVMFMPWYDD